jgi:hypothetical protein
MTAKYHTTNGLPVKNQISNWGVWLSPLAGCFFQLPLMSKKQISEVTLKLLENVSA